MEINLSQLSALESRLKLKFVDQEPRQTLQIEGFAPIYFRNVAADQSENLPGGSCSENLRKEYANPDRPYEPLVTAFFIWLSEQWPALSMIDVGALWGETSFIAASIFHQSNIHLFEMNPFVSQILQINADLNNHLKAEFHVQNMLVSNIDRQTTVTFKHYTARYGANEGGINLSPVKIFRENLKSLIKKSIGLPSRGKYIKQLMRIVTIDAYCRQQNFVPNLIKVDIEGSEYNALLGAKNTLSRHHPVLLVEFHPPDAANYIRKSNREMIRLLEGLDYKCLWGDHRTSNAMFHHIDSQTERDVEVDSLGIFY